jgi:hypothetical protein
MSGSIQERFEKLEHLETIILPKLESLQNTGNGSIIHTVNTMISLIRGWHVLFPFFHDENHIVKYENSLKEAEEWMVKYVQNKM